MRHKYLNLNMGLVEENFAIVNREEMNLWESRGFKKIRKYPIFHYTPNTSEVIMLGRPLNVREFGLENFKNSKIVDFCPHLGTYGMGGPGFAGFKLEGAFGERWLVYCIWSAGEHILLDNRILDCHPRFADTYRPWIDFDNQKKSLEELKQLLTGLMIQDIQLSTDELTITATDKNSVTHMIHTQKMSDKFPEQGGTGKRRKSYEDGSMEEYWLVIYDGTELSV